MPITTLQDTIEVSDDAICREMDGESVVLNLESATYFGLDEVGTRIWQLIEEHGALVTVFDQMRREYEVAPERLEQDLLGLVDQLVEKGLGTRQ